MHISPTIMYKPKNNTKPKDFLSIHKLCVLKYLNWDYGITWAAFRPKNSKSYKFKAFHQNLKTQTLIDVITQ
jgi:hypothetical protein